MVVVLISIGVRPFSYSLSWMINCCIIRHDSRNTIAFKTLDFTYLATAHRQTLRQGLLLKFQRHFNATILNVQIQAMEICPESIWIFIRKTSALFFFDFAMHCSTFPVYFSRITISEQNCDAELGHVKFEKNQLWNLI